MSAISKILIIQTAFIGDVVLTTPLIRELHKLFPRASISVLLVPRTANLLEGNPYVSRIIIYDKRRKQKGLLAFLKLADKLRRERFDLAVIPQRSFRSAFLAVLSKIPQRVGFQNSAGFFLLTHRIYYRKDVHAVERFLDLLRPWGVHPQDKDPEIFVSSQDEGRVAEFLRKSGIRSSDRLVAIAPGSVWPTKRWPSERFTTVARLIWERFGLKIVLIGGETDQQLCQQIAAALPSGTAAAAAGQMSLRQSAALLRRCEILVSNDSAPVHIAATMRVPVIAIFGPTIPDFGFAPWGKGNVVIQTQLDCRPCSPHGSKVCPRGHFRCMKEISTEQVFGQICEILRTKLGRH